VNIARHSIEPMRVAHLLRKYNPTEWGGTETAVYRLLEGLRAHEVSSVVYCPRVEGQSRAPDPFTAAGIEVKRFPASVPVWGISQEQRAQLVAVGGNLLSFRLLTDLLREPNLSLIHAHTHNRLGGIALTAARRRKLPLVLTLHGGVLDLPAQAEQYLVQPLRGGIEWGKVFGWLFRSRRVLQDADAVLTCNPTEARLLQQKFPGKRILTQPHGVRAADYELDYREAARDAFPALAGKPFLLVIGRIDPAKNQRWMVEQAPDLAARFPELRIVFAGACTNAAYGRELEAEIARRDLNERVILTGGLPPADPRLIGLTQLAQAVVLPSLTETFGLVILEAWAAGTAVISSRTSGACAMIRQDENGWLFDLERPEGFHEAVGQALTKPLARKSFVSAGRALVQAQYDTAVLSEQVKKLYAELIEEKTCAT
jgi:alpha-maltose-1-phosphate synthase